MGYNFIIPINSDRCIPANTVGLYMKVLLEHCASMPKTVAINGKIMTRPFAMCPKSQSGYTPRRALIPDPLLSTLRDLRLSRPFKIPLSYFKENFVNIVFVGHQIVLPQLSKNYKLIGLLDEPPSLSDNFKIPFIYRIVLRRFKQQLARFDKFWVYHEAGFEFLTSNEVQCPIYTFPCVLNYSTLIPFRKSKIPSAPFNIVMASSYLPWHGTSEMLLTLEPLIQSGQICITLIGDGPTRAETEKIAKNISGVTFLNGLDYDEYLTYLQKFDFGILWRIPWFNSPLKLMDYARAQIGIITYETKAIKSIFPQSTYYKIDEFIARLSSGTGFDDYSCRIDTMTRFINDELSTQKLQEHFNLIQS